MKTLKYPSLLSIITILLIIAVSFIFVPLPVAAFDWHTANQGTVAWDAVITIDNGDQVPAADIIEYSVYVSDSGSALKDSSVVAWRGAETSTVITFTNEGSFYVGVKAHRIRDGTELSASSISWSDDTQVTDNTPFGFTYWLPPSIVEGLKPTA